MNLPWLITLASLLVISLLWWAQGRRANVDTKWLEEAKVALRKAGQRKEPAEAATVEELAAFSSPQDAAHVEEPAAGKDHGPN